MRGPMMVSRRSLHRRMCFTYDFCKIHRANHNCLTDTQTGNKTASIDSTQVTISSHEDSNTNDPQDTELTGSPETADAIAN